MSKEKINKDDKSMERHFDKSMERHLLEELNKLYDLLEELGYTRELVDEMKEAPLIPVPLWERDLRRKRDE